jgi:hypothetical protein
MTIDLDPQLEMALRQTANQQGISAEQLVREWLHDRIVFSASLTSRSLHDWQELLKLAASDCGVALTDEALRREEIYA